MTGHLLSSLIRHPYEGSMWAICQLASKIAFLIGYKSDILERGLYKTISRGVEAKPLIKEGI
jgi:hypothetical protein